MSSAVQPPRNPRKFARFLGVVAVFALLGPLVGGLVVWVASSAHAISVGATSTALPLMLFTTLILILVFAYPVGIYFAVAAGIVVAAAGVWGRWNGVLVPVVSAAVASAFVLLMKDFLPPSRWGEPNVVGIFPICLVASVVCWFVTRDIVRSAWLPAS